MSESSIDLASFLEDVPLFKGLTLEDRQRIAAISEQRRYSGDEIIFSENEPGDRMFVIIWGYVHIQRRSEDGTTLTPVTLGPKQHFGEMAMLDDVKRSATAKMVETLESRIRGTPYDYKAGT